jgi:hypothetical protein
LTTFSYGAVKGTLSSIVHLSRHTGDPRRKTLKNTTRLNFGDGDEGSPEFQGDEDHEGAAEPCQSCLALMAIEDRIDGITDLLGAVRRNAAIAARELASLQRAFQTMVHGPSADDEDDLNARSRDCC